MPAPPDRFIARGRMRLVAGWQAVAGLDERRGDARERRDAEGNDVNGRDGESTLPPLTKGQRLDGRFETVAHQTRPPPRHTEATLLGAMESAGREIEDEALRAAMKDTGLGTPATRAATIETLVKRGFIFREGKQVVPTPTGIALIERAAGPDAGFARTDRRVGGAPGSDRARSRDQVRVHDRHRPLRRGSHRRGPWGGPRVAGPRGSATAPVTRATTAGSVPALPCPRCHQGTLMAGKRGWGCSRWRDGCPFVIWFEVAGKRITDAQLRDLIEKGKTRAGKWARPGQAVVAGRLVLNLNATREGGAAQFLPSF